MYKLACMYKVADVRNTAITKGVRPERDMLKKVLFAAGKTHQENNQSHPTT